MGPVRNEGSGWDETAGRVERARGGDADAFCELLHSHRDAVATTLRSCGVSRRVAAEDLAQEIALSAWTRLSTLKAPRAFPRWLVRIAANAARDHLRRGAVRHEEDLEALDLIAPDDPRERAERLAELRLKLAALAAEDEGAIALMVARAEGVPDARLARMLGVTPEAVRMRALRLRKRLQGRLDRLRKGDPRA